MGLTFAFGRGGTRPPSVTPDIEAPSAPTGLTASSVAQTTLTLTWSASTDNVGVVGYDVYNGATLDKTVTGLTASITGLTASTQYNFTVRAKDAAGNISEPSNVETVTTLDVVVDDSIYIDPTNSASGRNGSIENPYNSFVDSGITNGNTYKVKAGTVLTTSSVLDFSNRTDVTVTTYDVGDKPEFRFTGSGTCAVRFALSTRCMLTGLDINTNLSNSLVTLIQGGVNTGFNGGTDNFVVNCKIHNVKQGSGNGGMGLRIGGTNWTIGGCEIYDTGEDGIYMSSADGITIINNNIYNTNQNYAGASKGFNSLGNSAGGDAIQLSGLCSDFLISGNILDRSDEWTGNKYAIIFNRLESSGGFSDTGIIEHNIIKTRASVLGGIFIGSGTGIIVRYNELIGPVGVERLLKLGGYRCVGTVIHHNVFKNATRGIALGYIYSNNPDYSSTGGSINTQIFNNVFFNLSDAAIFNVDNRNVSVINNIFDLASAGGIVFSNFDGATWNIQNNAYSVGTNSGDEGKGTNAITSDVLCVDIANGDYHLQSTSPCMGAGVDVGLTEDYYGATIPTNGIFSIGVSEGSN